MIDKNKLKEKIQKTPSKDILYMELYNNDPKIIKLTVEEIKNFTRKKGTMVFLVRE